MKLKIIWKEKNIALKSKIRVIRSRVLRILLYILTCESWTLTLDLQSRIETMEIRCFRRLLNINYTDHIINEEVRNRIKLEIGQYEELLYTVKKRKLKWYGHVTRSTGLSKPIL